MESILKNQKRLLFFKKLIINNTIILFSLSYLFVLIALYLTTGIFKNNTKELFDLSLEILIFILSSFYIYLIFLYNLTFNKLSKLVDAKENLFEISSYYVKKYNFDNFLKKEQKEYWNTNFLFFYIIPIVIIITGNINIDINSEVTGKDLLYGLLLFFLTFLINIFIHTLLPGLDVILNDEIISKQDYSKQGIESYIIEIKEHLNIFNKTSIFRQRVETAINSITEIYLINKNSLERLNNDLELSSLIIKKNTILESELRQMLFSIINYNNERNDIILESINNNIKIINSLRN